MIANSMNKLWLLTLTEEIAQYNITLSITISRQLIDTVRLLGESYYFIRILDHWIEISKNNISTSQQNKTDLENKNNILPDLPESTFLIITDLQVTVDNDTIPELLIT